MNLPESLVKINKALITKVERTPEQLKEDEKRRLAHVAKQFNAAKALADKAQKELNSIKEEHKNKDDFDLNEEGSSFAPKEEESDSKVGQTVDQLEAQLKNMSMSLMNMKSGSNAKDTLAFKKQLQAVQANLAQVQLTINGLDSASKNSFQDNHVPLMAGSMPGPIAHNEEQDMRLNSDDSEKTENNIEDSSLV